MQKTRFEITYYRDEGKKRAQYHTDDRDVAITQAKILKDELGYFPVVVYDNHIQGWVDF